MQYGNTIAKQPDPVPRVRKRTKSRKTIVVAGDNPLVREDVKSIHKTELTENNADLAVLETQLHNMQLTGGLGEDVLQRELQDARAEAANYCAQLIEAFNRLSVRDKRIQELEAFKSK